MSIIASQRVLSLLSFALTLQLVSACTPTSMPNGMADPQHNTATASTVPVDEEKLFDSALSRQDVEAAAVLNSGGAVTDPAPMPGPVAPMPAPSAEPSVAPSAFASVSPIGYPFPTSDISASSGYSGGYAGGYYPGGYPMPYPGSGYFSGDFNQYVALRAERLEYPGSSANDLQGVYQERVQSILEEWDPGARLIESRGQSNPNPDQPEYIYLPGTQSGEPIRFNARWVFHLVSGTRKETLNVYINGDESRVYRVIYGQPTIDLSKAQISSSQAIATAKAAFANRAAVDYPVYPDPNTNDGPLRTIFYTLPEAINWRINLMQQGNTLVYHLSFDYTATRDALGLPYRSSLPTPSPMSGPMTTPAGDPIPTVTPTPLPPPTPMETPLPYGCYSYGSGNTEPIYLNGSFSMDAISGEILSVNRPVHYDYYYGDCMPYPSPYPSSYPSPYPTATADL